MHKLILNYKDDKLWVTLIYIKEYGSMVHPDIKYKGIRVLMGHPKVWIYKNHLFTGSWADGIKIKLIHSIKEMGLQQIANDKNTTVWVLVFSNNLWARGFEKMIENLGRSVRDGH